jgi:UDP-MurNAc hydroxylase
MIQVIARTYAEKIVISLLISIISMKPKIKWINHACFVYGDEQINLIADPWITGPVFNNGWAHISECLLSESDWREVTHIWISHEHPDHFSPQSLKSIPDDIRRSITVLFQRTADKRVVDFLSKCGFADVIELDQNWLQISSKTEIYCLPLRSDTNDDSTLIIKTGEFVTVNFNDCYFASAKQKNSMKELLPKVDLLFAQFSYASWAGNPGDLAAKKAAGHRAARLFLDNVSFFAPKWVIPCASNVWFSNTENFHLNEGLYTVRQIDEVIAMESTAQSIILYPRDIWEIGDYHDNKVSLARYDTDFAKVDSRNAIVNPVVSISNLKLIADRFSKNLLKINNRLLLALLPGAKIYVHDLEQSFSFSIYGLRETNVLEQDCDVRLGSESLEYCFKFLWGGDTLNINGRFSKPSGGSFWHFRTYFAVAALNNVGVPFNFTFVTKNIITVAKKFFEYRFIQS